MARLRQLLGWVTACGLLCSLSCSPKRKPGELAPLTAPGWRENLAVKGFADAIVALPLGATRARPIVVVIHGARDRAEWQCGSFRGVLGGKAFILCPQGVQSATPGVYDLGSFDDVTAELREGLAALKARYGAHVAPSPVLLVGYGEGAAVAADLARQEPSFFARVALIGGNPAKMTPSIIKGFSERGGKRVLFFCSDEACEQTATERALLLTRSNVPAKAVHARVGPYLDEAFTAALKPELSWLVEDDPRWAPRKR